MILESTVDPGLNEYEELPPIVGVNSAPTIPIEDLRITNYDNRGPSIETVAEVNTTVEEKTNYTPTTLLDHASVPKKLPQIYINENVKKNFKGPGYTPFFGNLWHFGVNLFLGNRLRIRSEEEWRALWANLKGVKDTYGEFWATIQDDTGSSDLVHEIQERMNETSRKIAEEIDQTFIPDQYKGIVGVDEFTIRTAEEDSDLVKAYYWDQDKVNAIHKTAQRNGKTYDDVILMAADGKFHELTRMGFPPDQLEFLLSLGSYNHFGLEDEPEIVQAIRTPDIIANTAARLDNAIFAAKAGVSQEVIDTINKIPDITRGNFFGSSSLLSYRGLTGPSGKVLYDFFKHNLEGKISTSILEIKTNSGVAQNPIPNNELLSVSHSRDVAHSINVWQTFAAATLGFRDTHILPYLKKMQRGEDYSHLEDKISRDTNLPKESKLLLKNFFNMFEYPTTQAIFAQIQWRIYDPVTRKTYITEKEKQPRYRIVSVKSQNIQDWLSTVKFDVLDKIMQRRGDIERLRKMNKEKADVKKHYYYAPPRMDY